MTAKLAVVTLLLSIVIEIPQTIVVQLYGVDPAQTGLETRVKQGKKQQSHTVLLGS